jgi:hypothetical protein
MRCFIIIVIIIRLSNFTAQNLVRNPSFELYSHCFDNNEQVYFSCIDWDTLGTPDYFNFCNSQNGIGVPNNLAGYQNAVNGFNYIGLWSFSDPNHLISRREYVINTLHCQLIKDSLYKITCFVGIHDDNKYAIKNFGLFISHNKPISTDGMRIDTIPQIRNNAYLSDSALWYKVEGDFLATGGEQYLTLGNFDHDSLVDWYRLYPFNNPNAGFSGAYLIIDSVWLSLKSQVPVVVPIDTIIKPKPIDSTIVENPIDCINIYPNPSAGVFQLECSEDITHIKVYDDIGRLVFQQFSNFQSIDLSFCRSGTYIVVIHTDTTVYRRKLVLLR